MQWDPMWEVTKKKCSFEKVLIEQDIFFVDIIANLDLNVVFVLRAKVFLI